jgi:hypothetical protein
MPSRAGGISARARSEVTFYGHARSSTTSDNICHIKSLCSPHVNEKLWTPCTPTPTLTTSRPRPTVRSSRQQWETTRDRRHSVASAGNSTRAMNTKASRARRHQRLHQQNPIAPYLSKSENTLPATTDKQFPDPWLFDTHELISALDKIRETIWRIPNATHEVHLRTLAAIDEVWRLREHLRDLLLLRTEMQHSFAQRASMLPSQTSRHVRSAQSSARDGHYTGQSTQGTRSAHAG